MNIIKKGLPRVIHLNGDSLDLRLANLKVLPGVPHFADEDPHAYTIAVDGRMVYLEHFLLGFDHPNEPADEVEVEQGSEEEDELWH